jgi:hypothetical protein
MPKLRDHYVNELPLFRINKIKSPQGKSGKLIEVKFFPAVKI